ncbi:MAG: MBL fold metallo-hydrolase [Treponema sp.]|nr:MBL fold metallo-hydrolase [Treponema sp.]
MNIQFWGVRGSIPTPASPSRVKSKISAIVEQITPEDLINSESRERFLARLPTWLFGTVGGNSPCVSITFDDNPHECIVFDAGSGLREMGLVHSNESKIKQYHFFFSHFHWDHIQGLPFFLPGYNPAKMLDFYSPVGGLESIISGQMKYPYFPVTLDVMASKKTYHYMEKDFHICNCSVSMKKMNHPGDSYAYSVNEKGKRFIYATDVELTPSDFMKTDENTHFFQDADLIVVDSQYTLGEAIEKYNWGHSAFSLAVDFAANWRIKHMVLFHHDPGYDDHKLYGILQSARWYLERMNIKGVQLTLAIEGLNISI